MHRSGAEGRFGGAEPAGRASVCAGAQTFGVEFFDCRGALRISFIVQLSKIDAPKGWGGPRLGCPRRRRPHAPSPIGCKRAVESNPRTRFLRVECSFAQCLSA